MAELTDLIDFGEGIFGSSSSQEGTTRGTTATTGTTTQTGTITRGLEIDDIAIERIIQELLGQAGGLADIFGGEQVAGIFGSSVTAQAAGDFAAKLAGEIAKLRAKEVTTEDREETKDEFIETTGTSSIEAESGGLLGQVFGSGGLLDIGAGFSSIGEGIEDLFSF